MDYLMGATNRLTPNVIEHEGYIFDVPFFWNQQKIEVLKNKNF